MLTDHAAHLCNAEAARMGHFSIWGVYVSVCMCVSVCMYVCWASIDPVPGW